MHHLSRMMSCQKWWESPHPLNFRLLFCQYKVFMTKPVRCDQKKKKKPQKLETQTRTWDVRTSARVMLCPSLCLHTTSSLQVFMVFLMNLSRCFWFMLEDAWTWVSTWEQKQMEHSKSWHINAIYNWDLVPHTGELFYQASMVWVYSPKTTESNTQEDSKKCYSSCFWGFFFSLAEAKRLRLAQLCSTLVKNYQGNMGKV